MGQKKNVSGLDTFCTLSAVGFFIQISMNQRLASSDVISSQVTFFSAINTII